jgi:adenylosuccinate synthase
LVVALSGPIGAGKTTIASALERDMGATVVATRRVLESRSQEHGRRELQRLGEKLDRCEGGSWVAHPVLATVGTSPLVVVDAVRTADQIAAIATHVSLAHIHLTASDAILERRYAARRDRNVDAELASYAHVRVDETERFIGRLAAHADLILDTTEASVADTCVAATTYVRTTID